MLNTTPLVTLLASRAHDSFFNASGELLREQEGGPALYIERVFRAEHLLYVLHTPPSVQVSLTVQDNEEIGTVERASSPLVLSYESFQTPFLFISTILDDFNLSGIESYRGSIFLDIQGYVRDPANPFRKRLWDNFSTIAPAFFCIKGTAEEMATLPHKAVADMQQRGIVLVTRGKEGCEVFAHGIHQKLAPPRVIKTTTTVGAGDTFFAHFFVRFSATHNVMESAQFALLYTSHFLAEIKI